MTIVRISADGSPDRLAEIGTGSFFLGSDLGCDLALFEEGVAARHLQIDVGDAGVFVQLAGDSPAVMSDGTDARTPMVPGERYPWLLGRSVVVAGLSISVAGPSVRLPPADPSFLARVAQNMMSASGRSLRVGLIGLGALVATATIAADVFDLVSVQASAPIPPERAEAVVNVPTATPEALAADLARLGFAATRITEGAQGLQVLIHVQTVAERAPLVAALSGLPYPVDATVIVEERMRAAVEAILAATEGGVKIVSLDKGRLVLSGLSEDAERRERMISVIKADVSGLTEVRFDAPVVTPADGLKSQIVAVWTGPRPYLVLADGKRVRVGETVGDGLTVTRIDPDGRVTLQMNDETVEFKLP